MLYCKEQVISIVVIVILLAVAFCYIQGVNPLDLMEGGANAGY